jgi:hypothetical protein
VRLGAVAVSLIFLLLAAHCMALTRSVSLNVSPTKAKLGSLFILTATVQDQSGNPVTTGRVTFYDGSAVLGTVEVVSASSGGEIIGTATLKTILVPLGANTLKAVYAAGAVSNSSEPEVATVTGQYPSSIEIASSGGGLDYVLTAIGAGGKLAAPTGNVTFTDNTTGFVAGAAALGEAKVAQTFINAATIFGFSNPVAALLADVNGDGIPDLLTGDANQITVAIGNGDGTFQAPSLMLSGAAAEKGIAAGDFNGDGKLDLAILSGGNLFVLLGKGDGTFGTPISHDSGSLREIGVGDFNGDGILDLVTLNSSGTVDLLLGKGDGTFKQPVKYVVSSPISLAIGDINGDGIVDLVVGTPNHVSVFLGNADGTLHHGPIYETQYEPGKLILGDFRGIGTLDLAMVFNQCCEGEDADVSIMLGNGDGTFQAGKSILSGSNYSGLAVGDFNGDGKLDLVVSDYGYAQVRVLLGNGDGTFQSAATYSTGGGPVTPVVADLNHDGWSDIVVPNRDDGTVSTLLYQVTETATATLENAIIPGTGMHSVVGAYSGDTTYLPATSNTVQLAASRLTATMNLARISSGTVTNGQAPILKVTVSGPLKSVPAPTGSVSYAIDGGTPQLTALAGGTATFPLGQISAGAHSIAISYSGDRYYMPLATATQPLPDASGSCTPQMNIAYYTIAGTDRDANRFLSGVSTNYVQPTLGTNGFPEYNPGATAISGNVYAPEDLLSDDEITWWSPALNNGGPGGASDVVVTGGGFISLPFANNAFFPPNGTGPNDLTNFQAAVLSGTLVAPAAETVNFTIASDDMAFLYLDGQIACDDGGVHGNTPVPCTSPLISAGPHTLELFYVDLNPTHAALDFNFTTSNVCVNPVLTISWPPPAPITYGTPLSAAQLDATSGGVAGTFLYAPPAGTVLPAGVQTLSVNFSPVDIIDFATVAANVQLIVNQATPTITWATPAAITYGTPLSATQLDATVNGVAGTFAYTPAADTVLAAGVQTLSATFTPTDTTDYATVTATAQLTVNQVSPTITWATPAAIAYGTPLSGAQLDASSGAVAGAFVYTPSAGTVLAAGMQTLSVTFTPTDTTDYTTATATVQLIVNRANPTITWATPAAITYGTPLSVTQLDASSGGVAGTFVYTPAAGSVLPAGVQTLSVTFTPTDTADYATATATVQQTVTKAAPAITWFTPAPIAYGTALSATQLDATASGVAGGGLAGTFAYAPVAGTVLPAGMQTLSVIFTPTDSTDYTTAAATVQLTVNKTTPTITWATPAAIAYGTPLSATQLDATVNGMAGTFAYTPAAGTVLPAGVQTLSVTFTPTDTTDYATASATVQLTVNKLGTSITWATPAAIVYGTPLSAAQLDASAGGVAGTFVYTPAAGSVLAAGMQTLSVTFTPTDTTDYMTATASVQLTVNKATPAITWATPAAITYGTPLSVTQLDASSGGVAGTFVYTPAAGSVLPAGVQTLSVTFTPTDTADYNNSSATVSLTVNLASVTVGLTSTSTSIPAGSPFTLTANVQSSAGTPTGVVTFLDGAIVLGTASLATGVATFPTVLLTPGSHTLTASYAGNAEFQGGMSNPVVVNVLPGTTATLLGASPNPAVIGATVTFTATVSSLAGTPSGSVSFLDGGALMGMGTLASGVATYSTNTLAAGSHNITANYGGASGFASSTSSVVVEVIEDFSISASPGSQSVYTGEAASYTVTVTSASGFSLPVTLSCSQMAPDTTCVFTPSTIGRGSGTSTLVVQTTAPSQASISPVFSRRYPVVALAGLLLLFIPKRLRRKGWPMLLVFLAFLAAGLAFTGCSGPRSLVGGTPVGAQTITVTGTATNGTQTLNHQTSVTLNVNSLF